MVPTHMSSEAAVSTGSDQTTIVELHLPAELAPRGAQVAGDFTAWTPISMPPSADGNRYSIAPAPAGVGVRGATGSWSMAIAG